MRLCDRCVKAKGLCAGCAEGDRSILPRLADNRRLKKLMADGAHRNMVPAAPPPPDPATARAIAKGKRKALRKLARALQGGFTRTTAAPVAA